MSVQTIKFARELIRERSGVVPIFLLTLKPDGTTPARMARAPYRILSRGERYESSWFDVDFADDVPDELAQYTLTMSNVHRKQVAELRRHIEPVPATIEVVTSADWETVAFGPVDVEASSRSIRSDIVRITFARDAIYRETVPNGTYNPRDEPSVFA